MKIMNWASWKMTEWGGAWFLGLEWLILRVGVVVA